MTAINPNALSKFVGILEVAPSSSPSSFVRLASVRDLVAIFDNAANQVDVQTDDNGTVFKGFTPEGRIEGEFLENFDRDTMEMLLGGTPSDTAGSLVSGATQVIASPIVADTFYPITNQNGDGSILTINSVTGATDGALTAHDDYQLVENDDGIYGIVFNTVAAGGTLTTLSQAVTVNYDYTPNASEDITFDLDFTESETLVVRITATDPSGNTRVVTLSEASFEGQYNMSFLDVVRNGDIQGTTFVFKGTKGSEMTIENEIL